MNQIKNAEISFTNATFFQVSLFAASEKLYVELLFDTKSKLEEILEFHSEVLKYQVKRIEGAKGIQIRLGVDTHKYDDAELKSEAVLEELFKNFGINITEDLNDFNSKTASATSDNELRFAYRESVLMGPTNGRPR
jgi:hypothetical protein